MRILMYLFMMSMLFACAHPQKIALRKGALLDPTMDPAASAGLLPSAMNPYALPLPERANLSGSGFSSSACPTCGQ